MFNKEELLNRLEREKINYRIWGRQGKEVALELEQACNFKFDSDVFVFISEIGNLGIGGNDILIAGVERQNCQTESEDAGLFEPGLQTKCVKIMDGSGLSYILYANGTIQAFEHHFIWPGESDPIIHNYPSFSSFLEALIEFEKYFQSLN